MQELFVVVVVTTFLVGNNVRAKAWKKEAICPSSLLRRAYFILAVTLRRSERAGDFMNTIIDEGFPLESHTRVFKNGTGELQTAPPAKNKCRPPLNR